MNNEDFEAENEVRNVMDALDLVVEVLKYVMSRTRSPAIGCTALGTAYFTALYLSGISDEAEQEHVNRCKRSAKEMHKVFARNVLGRDSKGKQ